MKRIIAIITLLAVFVSYAHAESDKQRFALVIGNAEYEGDALSALKNPVNDAALMSDALEKAGFSVSLIMNADLRSMKKAVKNFGASLTEAGGDTTALFYYSGHGFQANNLNYLAPIGAELEDEVDAEFEALSVDWVLARLERYNSGANVVVLDACRNTALTRSVRSLSQGLAMLSQTPVGSFISYSKAPGSTATDGTGLNSPYTAAIAREIIQPGVSIEQAFKKVRRSVVEETGGVQVPWDYSSLTTDIVFIPAANLEAIAKSQGQASTDQMQAELQFWNDVKDATSAASIEAYLTAYPDGVFSSLANIKLEEVSANAGSGEFSGQVEKLFARLSNRSLIVEKPTRPHEFYANARMRELQGDYLLARQDYMKFFAFGESYVDPHYRFQSFIKGQEGRGGALEIYSQLQLIGRTPTLKFARALLLERQDRVVALEAYISNHPNFAPAYYELSRDFSEARQGHQSLEDKKRC